MKQLRTKPSTMRRYLFLILILFFWLSCSRKSELQIEAEEKAQQWFEKGVIKCGDNYFTKVTYGLPTDRVNGIYQLKNPSFKVEEDKRTYTEADRLNNKVYDWVGFIYVYCTQYRRVYYQQQGSWQEGTPTYNPIPEASSESPPLIRKAIHKQNGQWNVDADTEPKFDCSDIQQ